MPDRWGCTHVIVSHLTSDPTFAVTELLFHIVHFQVLGNRSDPEIKQRTSEQFLFSAELNQPSPVRLLPTVPFRSGSIVALLTGST